MSCDDLIAIMPADPDSHFRLTICGCGSDHAAYVQMADGKWRVRSFSLRCTPAEKVVARLEQRARSAVFFMHFILADIPMVAVENPIGFMNTAFRKPDQIIHPYMFAESEDDAEQYVTKATCLWLRGLPKLKTNGLPKPDNAKLFGVTPSGKAHTWEDAYSRSGKVRSKTFPGIARAMAEQWGGRADG